MLPAGSTNKWKLTRDATGRVTDYKAVARFQDRSLRIREVYPSATVTLVFEGLKRVRKEFKDVKENLREFNNVDVLVIGGREGAVLPPMSKGTEVEFLGETKRRQKSGWKLFNAKLANGSGLIREISNEDSEPAQNLEVYVEPSDYSDAKNQPKEAIAVKDLSRMVVLSSGTFSQWNPPSDLQLLRIGRNEYDVERVVRSFRLVVNKVENGKKIHVDNVTGDIVFLKTPLKDDPSKHKLQLASPFEGNE